VDSRVINLSFKDGRLLGLMTADRHEAIVVGAGPAGLAAGAMLQARGVETLLLERTPQIGDRWRGHYDRLHLHTIRRLSRLPGLAIPRAEGRWVSRDGVARYLEAYARHHRLRVRLGVEVNRIERTDSRWTVRTAEGTTEAPVVVVATGHNRLPRVPPWQGRESFTGSLIHSSEYRNPEPYRGLDVLIVGTGNSGAEIAVDLAEGGARGIWLSVRTPPNILRRDLLGVPTQALGVLLRHLPVRVVDAVARATQRLTVGDLSPFGMPSPPRGVYTRLKEEDVLPILDVGLIRMLRRRRVTPVGAVAQFEGHNVILAGGERLRPDVVIAATGFDRGLEPLLGHLGLIGNRGCPVVNGQHTDPRAPGLFFIGYSNPISGNLREIAIDARRIAMAVAQRR
jgi:putative flavoprotein involved in K+ transport